MCAYNVPMSGGARTIWVGRVVPPSSQTKFFTVSLAALSCSLSHSMTRVNRGEAVCC